MTGLGYQRLNPGAGPSACHSSVAPVHNGAFEPKVTQRSHPDRLFANRGMARIFIAYQNSDRQFPPRRHCEVQRSLAVEIDKFKEQCGTIEEQSELCNRFFGRDRR